MLCPTCRGKKIIEIMGGVIVKRCETCKGRGEIEDDPVKGTGQNNSTFRARDTSKPRQKRKPRKAIAKRTG